MKIFPQKTVSPHKNVVLLKEKKTYTNDCLNCLLSPTLKFSFLMNPIVGKCKHLNPNHGGKVLFEACTSFRNLTLLLLSSLFIGNLIYFRQFAAESETYVLFIAGSYNIIKAEVILFILMVLLLKLSIREHYLSRLSYLLENKKFYAINNFICKHCSKFIRSRIYLMIYGSLLILLMYPLIYYVQYGLDAFNYTNLIFFYTASVQSCLVYNSCVEFDILRLIYRSVHISLTGHLENRRNHVYSVSGSFPLEEKLRRISHLYLELRNCVDIILDYVGFGYILTTMSMTFLLILNTYSMFLILNSGGCCLWLVQINTLTQVWVLVNLIRFAQGASDQSGETLKYLFSYPISRLKDREAFQVELIIKALVVRNPRIDIKNMFTLDTGFIASIACIIVTFSMVVIQLHIVLDENDMNADDNTDYIYDYIE